VRRKLEMLERYSLKGFIFSVLNFYRLYRLFQIKEINRKHIFIIGITERLYHAKKKNFCHFFSQIVYCCLFFIKWHFLIAPKITSITNNLS